MRRILKYLRPYTWLLVLSIILLFIQAYADLALPAYMARIVNVGIQQGGVESPVPEAVRQSTFEHLALFLSAVDRETLLKHYVLVDESSPEYERYLQKYPALADGPIYILRDTDRATLEALNPLMSKAMLIVFGIEQIKSNPSQAKALFPQMGVDLTKLPPGVDLFSQFTKLPESQRAQISAAMNQRFTALGGEKAIAQAAALAVRAEYDALGMNAARIQSAYILYVGGQMLIIALISAVATITVGLLGARIAAGLARDLRRFFFEKVMRFSNPEFDRFSTASLITRSTNDITQIQMVTAIMVRMVFYAPIIAVGGILRALGEDVSMWWIIASAVLVLLVMIMTVFSISVPKFKIIQKLIDRLNLVARENLTGMMVVRAFDRKNMRSNVLIKRTEI